MDCPWRVRPGGPASSAADAGEYTVVVSNALGSVMSNKAVLAVNQAPPPPSPPSNPSGGGKGGGGAPSLWFVSATLGLWFVRRFVSGRK